MRALTGAAWEKGPGARAHWVAEFRSFPDHPIFRGVTPFKIDDGWLYQTRFAPGMKGVTQIARVRCVHTKHGVLDIIHRPHVHLVAKNVALRNETGQFVQKLSLLHLADALDQKLAVNRRAGESHRLEKCDFASA